MTRTERENIYIKRLSEVNPNIILTGLYKSNKTPTEHKCLIHDITWEAYPFTLLKGYGCKECGKEKISKANKMSHNEFINKFKSINNDILIIGTYINNRTKIEVKCNKCENSWFAFPSNLLNNQGCKKCSVLSRTFSHKEYAEKIQNLNVDVIEKYINSKTKILHRCKQCNEEWMITPSDIMNGYGCPVCAGVKHKTHKQYIDEILNCNPNIEVIGEYVNNRTKILHKCKKCNYTWNITPHDILRLHGCPKCNSSSGELMISKILTDNGIKFIEQYKFDDCCDKRSLPFDFYLPDYNILIEYQGLQHY